MANWRLRVRRIREYVRRIGDYMFGELEIWKNMFGKLEIWRKVFGNLEKKHGEIRWQFRGDVFGDLEKTYLVIFGKKCVGDLEKSFGDIGENGSAITLEFWRNGVGVVMAILYWSSQWSSMQLGDHKWRLDHNGEKVETIYGDQNFVHHKVESTYLGRFKDRNV